MKHRNHTNREISGNPPADLKETQRSLLRLLIPIGEMDHILNSTADQGRRLHLFLNTGGGKHIAQRGILPTRHDDRQVLFRRRLHPGIFRVNLIILFQQILLQDLVKIFMREFTHPGLLIPFP